VAVQSLTGPVKNKLIRARGRISGGLPTAKPTRVFRTLRTTGSGEAPTHPGDVGKVRSQENRTFCASARVRLELTDGVL
jgi:hypothetical protein